MYLLPENLAGGDNGKRQNNNPSSEVEKQYTLNPIDSDGDDRTLKPKKVEDSMAKELGNEVPAVSRDKDTPQNLAQGELEKVSVAPGVHRAIAEQPGSSAISDAIESNPPERVATLYESKVFSGRNGY